MFKKNFRKGRFFNTSSDFAWNITPRKKNMKNLKNNFALYARSLSVYFY